MPPSSMLHRQQIDDIISSILDDRLLFQHIGGLVKQRLPPSARADKFWCKKVIMLTIDEAFNDLNVAQLLQDAVETTVRPTTTQLFINAAEAERDSPVELPTVTPTFSSTEPVQVSTVSGRWQKPKKRSTSSSSKKVTEEEIETGSTTAADDGSNLSPSQTLNDTIDSDTRRTLSIAGVKKLYAQEAAQRQQHLQQQPVKSPTSNDSSLLQNNTTAETSALSIDQRQEIFQSLSQSLNHSQRSTEASDRSAELEAEVSVDHVEDGDVVNIRESAENGYEDSNSNDDGDAKAASSPDGSDDDIITVEEEELARANNNSYPEFDGIRVEEDFSAQEVLDEWEARVNAAMRGGDSEIDSSDELPLGDDADAVPEVVPTVGSGGAIEVNPADLSGMGSSSHPYDYDDNDFEAYESEEEVQAQVQVSGKRHIRFSAQLEHHFETREKYTRAEVAELFYTHEESQKFNIDFEQEYMRATALGQTWNDWIESRTDEDVAREEEEMAQRRYSDDIEVYEDDEVDDEDDLYQF